jgi:uncharacterized protein
MPFVLKRWLRIILPALLCALLSQQHANAADEVAVPALHSPVTDLTNTLTADQVKSLENTLRAFETRKGSQFAILIVPTTQPDDSLTYSVKVFDQWKLGRKSADDGVLLLIAKQDREVRFTVGRGLEGVLTDALTHQIIRETLLPSFKAGQFYAGIDQAVGQVIKVVDGEALPEVVQSSRHQNNQNLPWPLLIFVAIAVGSVLRAIFGRLAGAGMTAALVGLLVWWFASTVLLAVIGAAFAFVFTLSSGGRGGWINTGGFGGGGFGGGGGGWSGGGGGTAGGGASGRW